MQKTANWGLFFRAVSSLQLPPADSRFRSEAGSFRLPAQMPDVVKPSIRKFHRSSVKKLLITMKMLTVLLFAASLTVSARSVSQGVTLSGKDLTLKQVFSAIEKQTGYVVFANKSDVLRTSRISLTVHDMPVRELLKLVLKDRQMEYFIKDKTIVLTEKPSPAPGMPSNQPDLTIYLPADPVTGRVFSSDGKPLPGASVSIKNGAVSGITDAEGRFSLQVNEGDVLVISFVGYTSREIKITTSLLNKAKQNPGAELAELNITLALSNSKLDEVQVIAYGTTTVRLNTGSVAKMKGEDIRKQPVDNPLLALGGRLPGVQIAQTNGLAGAPVSVIIRGKSSLGAASDPLYVIDGVPFAHSLTSITFGNGIQAQSLGGLTSASFRTNPFVAINPADIESIEVLKDADATAIYGSRGANGVILITTRKAKAGKTSVDANFYTGWGRPTKLPEFMNTEQYIAMRKEAFKNDNITPTTSNATDLMVWDNNRYTDWTKLLLGKQARSSDAQLRLSGGDQQTQFSLAGSYHRETPVYYGNMHDDRIGFHSNIIHRSLDNKFQVSFNAGYSSDMNNIITTDLTQLLNTVPNSPYPFDESGNLVWRDKGINFSNPLAYTYKTYIGKTENLLGNLNMRYNITEGLQLRVDAGYTAMTLNQRTENPIRSQSPYSANLTSSAQFYNQVHKNWIVEPQAEYTKRWGKGKLQVLIGSSLQEQLNEGNTITASGYSNDDLLKTPGQAANKSVSSTFSKYHYAAVFGRINYNWDSKYLINVSARRDGSSRFGPGKQFGNFGAVGAGWIFSEESFIENLHFLHFGKLRASMGVTGNDRIGDYQYLASWKATNSAIPYQGLSGLFPADLFNPDFAWERNRKWEAAIELSFLKDRIFFSADYYLNKTDNQLTGLTLPTQVGFPDVNANRDAILQNSGWELMLNTTNLQNGHFSWKSAFNITLPKNKLIAYPGLEDTYYASVWNIGMPVTIKKSVPYLGVDPQTGIHTLAGISIPKDQTSVNDMAPKYYGGLQNTIEYRSFSLDFFFHFLKQKGMSSILFQAPGSRVNQPVEMLARWQKPGDITNVQRFATTGTPVTTYSYYANYSDARIVDASYIRLRNVSLSYRFSKNIAQKIRAQDCRVYFQGQNLLTFTPYKISDPETMSLSGMPPMRMLTLGCQVVF